MANVLYVLYTLEKNAYADTVSGIFYKHQLDLVCLCCCWILMFAASQSNCPIHYDLGIKDLNCYCGSVHFSFQFYQFFINMFFNSVVCCKYTFRIAISSLWIDLVSLYNVLLFLVIIFVLKYNLSDMNVASSDFLWYMIKSYMIKLFPFIYFNPACIVIYEVSILKTAYSWLINPILHLIQGTSYKNQVYEMSTMVFKSPRK